MSTIRVALFFGAFATVASPALGQVLRYGGEAGDTHHYVRTQTDHIAQTVNGAEQKIDIESFWRFSSTVVSATDDEVVFEIVHDSLDQQGSPTGAVDFTPLYGKPVTVTMDAKGRVSEVVVPDSLPPALGQLDLATTYQTFFPTVPGESVAEGTAWSDTTDLATNQNGIDIDVHRETSYTATGTVDRGGYQALKVEFISETELDGAGSQAGNEIALNGGGTSAGVYYFDAGSGAFLGGEESSEIKMDAFVTAGGQNLLIPIVQTRTETIDLAE